MPDLGPWSQSEDLQSCQCRGVFERYLLCLGANGSPFFGSDPTLGPAFALTEFRALRSLFSSCSSSNGACSCDKSCEPEQKQNPARKQEQDWDWSKGPLRVFMKREQAINVASRLVAGDLALPWTIADSIEGLCASMLASASGAKEREGQGGLFEGSSPAASISDSTSDWASAIKQSVGSARVDWDALRSPRTFRLCIQSWGR